MCSTFARVAGPAGHRRRGTRAALAFPARLPCATATGTGTCLARKKVGLAQECDAAFQLPILHPQYRVAVGASETRWMKVELLAIM